MFLNRERLVLLHLTNQVVPTTAHHPFFVVGRGWINAAELRVGDVIRTADGQETPIEKITATGAKEIMSQMAAASPFARMALWSAGTPIQTTNGPKRIEDIRAGDFIVVPRPGSSEQN